MKHKAHQLTVKTGDVVLIKGDEKNRGKWKMEIVKQIIQGRDRNEKNSKTEDWYGTNNSTLVPLGVSL